VLKKGLTFADNVYSSFDRPQVKIASQVGRLGNAAPATFVKQARGIDATTARS
jgi:hypothetical protein